MDIYTIVKKLIGNIEPCGDSQTDKKRHENLIEYKHLISNLIEDFIYVSKEKGSYEESVRKLGLESYTYLLELKEDLNDLIKD